MHKPPNLDLPAKVVNLQSQPYDLQISAHNTTKTDKVRFTAIVTFPLIRQHICINASVKPAEAMQKKMLNQEAAG